MPWETKKVEDAIVRLQGNIADASPAMREVQGVVVKAIERNFETESAAGDPWEELAEATLEDRERKGFPPGPILERTGDLKEAATGHRAVGPDFAEVGLEDGHPYGKFHVSEKPRMKIPLRDFLAVGEDDQDKIAEIIVGHLLDDS